MLKKEFLYLFTRFMSNQTNKNERFSKIRPQNKENRMTTIKFQNLNIFKITKPKHSTFIHKF